MKMTEGVNENLIIDKEYWKESFKLLFKVIIDYIPSKIRDIKTLCVGIDYPMTKDGHTLKPFFGCVFKGDKRFVQKCK